MNKAGPSEANYESDPIPFKTVEALYIELTEEAADSAN